jgi:hypothetical protein
MKFCYLDESGIGDEPFLVLAGVIVDGSRMHRTKEAWADILNYLSDAVGRKIPEFHFRKFYQGSGPWRSIDGPERAKITSAILRWIKIRRHRITFSAVNKEYFNSNKNIFEGISNPWDLAAIHCIIGLQKYHQRCTGIKGHTVTIFDHARREIGFTNTIINPPDWIHSFYNKESRQLELDHIIDVPFFADSEQVLLIQVADIISYILRRYAELNTQNCKERYSGEFNRMSVWIELIKKCCIPSSMRYPARGRCIAAQKFWDIAPECLRL